MGKAKCGCEFIDGTCVDMCKEHLRDYNNSIALAMGKSKVTRAFEAFMIELFGEVPEDVQSRTIDRETYTRKMREVQERHGLVPGNPDFLEWVLTLTGRSPKITEGAGENEPT